MIATPLSDGEWPVWRAGISGSDPCQRRQGSRPLSRRIGLALTLHNHQPVGNFGWVIEETYQKAYQPTLAILEDHPGVRLGLHYTGPLLEWIEAEHPDFLARLRVLVDRDQVELLGGGLFEPVLAALPERDRVAQLVRMADEVERIVGRRPRTAWLAERVWEPDLPTSLVAAGYEATILDDAHFRSAGIPEDAMWGPYTTEDQGALVSVFGTEQGLRARIPFRPVGEVIEFLRDHATEAGERVGTMGDDGEKFGAWPTTWDLCWGAGRWMGDFFAALEANADWLVTTTPSDWLRRNGPLGRVYVPVGSYAEMGAWALLPEEGRRFAEILERDRAEGRPEPRWMRGASWRNFQVKYREVNDLHKRMLRVSAKVEALPRGSTRDGAQDHLLRGQSNDVYWHGLFGGIYLPDLRLATLGQLIRAEDIADSTSGTLVDALIADLDLDGRDEVRIADSGQVVTVDLDEGAGIGDWDLRAARHALTSVMRRRPEAYHEWIRQDAQHVHGRQDERQGVGSSASIHEIVQSKETGLADHLRYDDHERRSGLIRFLPLEATPAAYGAGEIPDLANALDVPFQVVELVKGRLVAEATAHVSGPGGAVPIRMHKTIELGGMRLTPSLRVRVAVSNEGANPIRARLGLEWAFMLLGGGGNPSAWFDVAGERTRHDLPGSADRVDVISQGNDWLGVRVASYPSPAADAWWAPIETVSNSEAGFERVYQGSSMLLSWCIDLAPGASHTVGVTHRVDIDEGAVGSTRIPG